MNSQKKKALIIAYNDLNNSGVPSVIFRVVSSLSFEYDFDIVVFGDDDYYYKKMLTAGISPNIIKFKTKTKKQKESGAAYHFFKYPKLMYTQAFNIMSSKKYDVVHSFKENYSWPFLKAAKACGITKRIVHSNIDNSRKKNIRYKILDRINRTKTLHIATHLIGVSTRCCKTSFGKKRSIVLHNSYDSSIFNNEVLYEGENGHLSMAQIGTYNSNKNQLFSLEIALMLKNKNIPFSLLLLGRETEKGYKDKIIEFINEHSLSNDVKLIDGSNGVGSIYNFANCVLIPSKSEGAPLVAIEAQACGIKVFASTSVPQEMDAGGMVFIDKKASPSVWCNTILDYYKNNGYDRKKYNMDDFSCQTFKDKLIKIYKE